MSGPNPREIPPSFCTSSSVEMGISLSTTMLSAPTPVQPSFSLFVPAQVRVAEFERLREELRKREKQLEVLRELDIPQCSQSSCGPQVVPSPSQPLQPISNLLNLQHHHHQRHQRHLYPSADGAARPDLIPRGQVSQASESRKFRPDKCSGGHWNR